MLYGHLQSENITIAIGSHSRKRQCLQMLCYLSELLETTRNFLGSIMYYIFSPTVHILKYLSLWQVQYIVMEVYDFLLN